MGTTVVMVGADKGGVGKTTISRALIDYAVARGRSFKAFDTQSPGGDLSSFNDAEVVDLNRTQDQMKIFDDMPELTIIDVRGGLLAQTIATLDHVGLLADVKAGLVHLVLMHVMGPNLASLNEVLQVGKTLGEGARIVFVRNHIGPNDFYGWENEDRFANALKTMQPMDVPYLDAAACERVQQLSMDFVRFASDPQQSRILRGYVKAWLDRVYAEFDRVGVLK